MQHHSFAPINDSYRCRRSPSGDIVFVYNSDSYLMAEYNIKTTRTSWQRVVPAGQRDSVEKWLVKNYPVPATPQAARAEKLKATAAKN